MVYMYRVMTFKKSFMSENINTNYDENEKCYPNSQENDYENLITRLKEIKINIAILEKIILR